MNSDQAIQMPAVQDTKVEIAKLTPSPQDSAKIKTLKEIFLSKNDNDPRIDSEFKTLTPELKQELKSLYRNLPKESLNQRGTVLFILSKDLSHKEDLEIFGEALKEPSCLSFTNCSNKAHSAQEDHLDSVNEASLLYPQLVALNRLENLIHKADFFSQTDDYIREVREVLQSSALSKEPRIQAKAQALLDFVLKRGK